MLFHKCRCGALIPQNIAECEACAAKAAGQQSRHMEYNKHRRNKKTAAFYVSSEWRKTRAETIRRFDGVDIYAFYVLHHIHISTSKSNRRKARGEVQLYNTSKQKKEKTQEVADKLDHGVFKKSCGCLRAALHHH